MLVKSKEKTVTNMKTLISHPFHSPELFCSFTFLFDEGIEIVLFSK